ncbi:MAG: glycoside hydrolase [Planctomycetota bacterium]
MYKHTHNNPGGGTFENMYHQSPERKRWVSYPTKQLYLIGLIILTLSVIPAPGVEQAAPQTQPIKLPSWQTPADYKSESFRIGSKYGQVDVWGQGREPTRTYFQEFLPAIFERTIIFDNLEINEKQALDWIFTGERGGITLRIEKSTVRLKKRSYDSYALAPIEKPSYRAGRHPEKTWLENQAPYTGHLSSVTVILDHKLSVSVLLNGKEAIRHQCALDLSRHQLKMGTNKGSAQGKMIQPASKKATIIIDPSKKHQNIIGFGGIATPTAYHQLSQQGKKQWWQYLTEYNLLIQREFPNGNHLNRNMDNFDQLQDATRHYYGDNFPNGEISDFEYIKTLRQLDGIVFFEFWGLPPWARQKLKDPETGKPGRAVADPQKYADVMVNYCRLSKQRTGAPPEIVGIQNERTQPADIWHKMTLTLRRELDRNGFKETKIHMADAGRLYQGISFAKRFQESPQAWATIDYAASHMYDYQKFFNDPDKYDYSLKVWKKLIGEKPFLSTELCINQGHLQRHSYRIALTMGQLYHKNLTIADASAICYCWTILNVVQPSYGWTRSLFVPDRAHGFTPKPSSHQLRVFGAYSRRVQKGMTRIEANASDPHLLATAFEGDNNARTVIVINRSTIPRNIKLKGIDTKFTYCEYVDPYNQNAVSRIPSRHNPDYNAVSRIPSRHNSDHIELNPGQILTLSNVPLIKLPENFQIFKK